MTVAAPERLKTFPVMEIFGPTDLPDRIASKIKVDGRGCWLWLGGRSQSGYGGVWFGGRMRGAHVAVYELLVGPIESGMQLDHFLAEQGCPRNCVNPAHLRPTTPRENTLRSDTPAARNLAKTTCVNGHSLADCYRRPDGRRRCSTCERERSLAYQRAKRGGVAT